MKSRFFTKFMKSSGEEIAYCRMKLTESQINLIVERYFAWENPVEIPGWPGRFRYFYNPREEDIHLAKISIGYGKHKLPEYMRKERLKRELIKRLNYEADTHWLDGALEFLKGRNEV